MKFISFILILFVLTAYTVVAQETEEQPKKKGGLVGPGTGRKPNRRG